MKPAHSELLSAVTSILNRRISGASTRVILEDLKIHHNIATTAAQLKYVATLFVHVGRGRNALWCLHGSATAATKSETTAKKKENPSSRLTIEQRREIGTRLAEAMFLESRAPEEEVVEQIRRQFSHWKLPKNLSGAVRPQFDEAYNKILLDRLQPPPPAAPITVVDLTKAASGDLLAELLSRSDAMSVIASHFTSPAVRSKMIQTVHGLFAAPPENVSQFLPVITNAPAEKAKKFRVLITSLLPGQITGFQSRPKIQANAEAIKFTFLEQDHGWTQLPSGDKFDLVITFAKAATGLWNAVRAKYNCPVEKVEGVSRMETILLERLLEWQRRQERATRLVG